MPYSEGNPNYRAVFDASPGLYLVLTPDLVIVGVTDAYARATLQTRGSLMGRRLFEVFPDNPDDPAADGVQKLRESLERVITLKRPDVMAVLRYDIPRPDENGSFEERYWSPVNIPVFNRLGQVGWIIHRVEDVTAQVRLEQRSAERAELIREQQIVVEQLRITNQELAHEVEHRKQIELQLVHALKMEAIGNLTGGLAHDFNNLLGVVIGNLEMLRTGGVDAADARELLNDSLEAALRGADLTRRLLAFARRQPLQPQRVQLNDLIRTIMRLLARVLGENIDVRLDLSADEQEVVVDPGQLEAALVNLATNARDAMARGGRLTIATGTKALDADYAAAHPEVVPGEYALISVADSGTGIPPDAIHRIFEPFYTTKARDKGTGLGLSMVYGFMKQTGGHVSVYSEPGNGTVFHLYLPRRTGVDAIARTAEREAGLSDRRETVLAVEDNEALRRVLVRQLRSFGFTVVEAASGAAALALLEAGTIDILFTDIVMPGEIDGFELVRIARERWPGLRIVMTSGFAELSAADTLGTMNIPLLSKPSRREDLARALRQVLDT